MYSFFNSCLFYYSCPNFPLCLPPSSPPIPTVHPHTVVYGSFIYALWLIPSPSFYHSPLPLMHPHVHSSTVYSSQVLEIAWVPISRWMDQKNMVIHTVEYYAAERKNWRCGNGKQGDKYIFFKTTISVWWHHLALYALSLPRGSPSAQVWPWPAPGGASAHSSHRGQAVSSGKDRGQQGVTKSPNLPQPVAPRKAPNNISEGIQEKWEEQKQEIHELTSCCNPGPGLDYFRIHSSI